jgi:hypothetical protein
VAIKAGARRGQHRSCVLRASYPTSVFDGALGRASCVSLDGALSACRNSLILESCHCSKSLGPSASDTLFRKPLSGGLQQFLVFDNVRRNNIEASPAPRTGAAWSSGLPSVDASAQRPGSDPSGSPILRVLVNRLRLFLLRRCVDLGILSSVLHTHYEPYRTNKCAAQCIFRVAHRVPTCILGAAANEARCSQSKWV